MSKRAKYVAFATVALFLFTAAVYACPGVAFAANRSPSLLDRAPHHDDTHNEPGCADREVNLCQSVRDQIVSIKAPTVDPVIASVPIGVTAEPVMHDIAATAFVYGRSPPIAQPFHPVFKLQLALSYLVLRR